MTQTKIENRKIIEKMFYQGKVYTRVFSDARLRFILILEMTFRVTIACMTSTERGSK